jgi:group I intron endonuclease
VLRLGRESLPQTGSPCPLFEGALKLIVYLISNKKNGKKYVGQHAGNDLGVYWRRTVWLAEAGYQGKRALYRAIRKYGSDNFEVKVLVIVGTKEEMDRYEIGLIRAWDTINPNKGYNITAGGDGSLGVKMSEETRDKMSKSRLGKPMPAKSKEILQKLNKGNKYALGHKMTEDNFNKLMAAHIGAKRSDEARQRMSEAHKGKGYTDKQWFAIHERAHVARNKNHPNCKFCNS